MVRRLLVPILVGLLCLSPTVSVADDAGFAAKQTVVMVFDTSGSMKGARLQEAKIAARQVVAATPTSDPVALVTFSKQVNLTIAATDDHERVRDAITSLEADGDTALYDAIIQASALTKNAEACTILLLTDGEDTTSKRSRAQAMQALHDSACTMFAISLDPNPKVLRTLRQFTDSAYGKTFSAAKAEDIARIFASSIAASSSIPNRIAVMVLDTSQAVAGAPLETGKSIASRVTDGLPARVSTSVVTTSDSASVLTARGAARSASKAALADASASGHTTLNDAVIAAAAQAQGSRRCSILILAGSPDDASAHSTADARQALASSGCATTAIALRKDQATQQSLRGLVNGEPYTAAEVDLQSMFAALLAALGEDIAALPGHAAGGTPSTDGEGDSGSSAPGLGAGSNPADAFSWRSSTVVAAVALLTGASLFTFIVLLLQGSNRSQRRRIEAIIDAYAMQRMKSPDGDEERTFLESLEDLLRPVLARKGRAERLSVMLDGAAIDRSPEQWTLIRFALLVAVWLLASVGSGSAVVGVLCGLLAAGPLPRFWLNRRRKRRARRFEEGLPDSLMLMASSLRSGFALDQAIVAACDQGDNEVSIELRRAVQEIRIGVPLEDALDRTAARIGSADFKWVVTALRIQRRSGGNLAELLVTVARTVRQRGELAREVKALTSEGRMSSYVLIALPIGIFFFLLLTQASYLAPLWSSPAGWMLSGVAIGMLAVGWLLMQKLIKVDV